MSGEQKKLNPRITSIEIGTRSLRKITIYPLSMAAELELSDLITQVLQEFYAAQDKEDLAFITIIVDLIKDNLSRILDMITDDDVKSENLLEKLDNYQATELAEIIFDINFAGAIKKAMGLFEKVRNIQQSPSKRSLQSSASDTEDTDLSTSIKEATEMEG